MQHKKIIDYRPWLVGLTVVALIVSVGVMVQAFSYGNTITNSNVSIDQRGMEANVEGQNIGAFTTAGSNFTDVQIAGELDVTGESRLTATTSLQEIVLGSRFKKALTFTAGVTTTPGGLVALQNTGADKLCQKAEILTTANVQGSMDVSLATSTSATAISGNGVNLIATTTIATTTKVILSSSIDDQAGSGLTNGSESFLWLNGTYILGSIDAKSGRSGASSTDYSSAVGYLYLTCHSQ